MNELTHFNRAGEAQMVDVGAKPETERVAQAEGCIRMQPETLRLIEQGGHAKGDVLGIARIAAIMGAKRTADLVPLCHPLALTKVDCSFEVLQATTAEVQHHERAAENGTGAHSGHGAKADVANAKIGVAADAAAASGSGATAGGAANAAGGADAPAEATVICRATVATRGRTGVEMEALCAVQIALLTIYDMCKAVDRGMVIDGVSLREKRGGRSGHWVRQA